MFHFFHKFLNPSCYHGQGKKPPFFEGWYYKIIDQSENFRFAVIPGIYISKDRSKSHTFIQTLDGSRGHSSYVDFPVEKFNFRDGEFDVRLGTNHFTADYFKIDINNSESLVRGELHFKNQVSWPVSMRSPGIMGWYAWVPFMECYHGIISLDHLIEGELTIDNHVIDFTGGRGYIEKDWGKSFPAAWIWLQTNHFEETAICLTASVAIIPWFRGAFPGFIIGLWYQGKLYKFATYTGARIEKLKIENRQIFLSVYDKHHRLEITADRTDGGPLRAPTTVEMERRISESMTGTVQLKFYALAKSESKMLLCDTGRNAGIEVNGDINRLINMWKSKI
jgi:hypothetical protein